MVPRMHYLCAPPIACREIYTRTRARASIHAYGDISYPIKHFIRVLLRQEKKDVIVPGRFVGESITFTDMQWGPNDARKLCESYRCIKLKDLQLFCCILFNFSTWKL